MELFVISSRVQIWASSHGVTGDINSNTNKFHDTKRMKGLAEFVFQKKQSEPRLAVNHKYLLRDKISLHWSTLNAIKLNK